MALTIRLGRPEDTDIVADMNARLAHESEDKILDPAILTAGVRAVLGDPMRGRYYIAELDGVIVGQTMITLEWSDWRNGWIWWIQSVYVQQPARRQGVFRALFQHILQEAQATGVVGLRLYVERDNHAAQKTYLNMGMRWTSYGVLERCPL